MAREQFSSVCSPFLLFTLFLVSCPLLLFSCDSYAAVSVIALRSVSVNGQVTLSLVLLAAVLSLVFVHYILRGVAVSLLS